MTLTLTPDEVRRIRDALDRDGGTRHDPSAELAFRFLYTSGASRLMYAQTFSGGSYTLSVRPDSLVGSHGGNGQVTLTIREG